MATLKEGAQVAVEARRDKGSGSGKRLREIERILRQHRVLSGLTPEKATSLLEDLGPTFVKMGQIAANRSDVIPPAYADAFKRLRADVPPMRGGKRSRASRRSRSDRRPSPKCTGRASRRMRLAMRERAPAPRRSRCLPTLRRRGRTWPSRCVDRTWWSR